MLRTAEPYPSEKRGTYGTSCPYCEILNSITVVESSKAFSRIVPIPTNLPHWYTHSSIAIGITVRDCNLETCEERRKPEALKARQAAWIAGTCPPFLATLIPTARENSLVGSTLLDTHTLTYIYIPIQYGLHCIFTDYWSNHNLIHAFM
jgi:hypothetical protein